MLQLTSEGCAARRKALIERAAADVLIITNPRHIQYFSGLYITPLALSAWGLNSLIIDAVSGESTLVVHNAIEDDAKAAHTDHLEVWRSYDQAINPGVDPYRVGVEELNRRVKGFSGKRIGAEIGWLPLGAGVSDSLDISGMILDMRRRKYPDEVALIREAIRAIAAGHMAAREAIQPDVTELDVYSAVQGAIVNEAGHAVLLMGDFAAGGRSGGPATGRILEVGQLMIVDVFPIVNGYRGDYTATISVDRRLTDQQKALETALLAAMSAGEAMLKPGVRASDVYSAVRAELGKHNFAEGFYHHAGHGLGLGHPEPPYFVPNSDETLRVGDVVTLEPGSYGKGIGARVENNYLITENGAERLTEHKLTFI